jgi:prophage antirepressor-like protein
MNQSLTVFNFCEFPVRVVIGEDGEPWFVVNDACRILEIVNIGNAVARLDKDGIRQADVTDSSGRTQMMTITNEPNLYRLIFRSDKPEAKVFQDWVYNDVLPAIRKTGSYSLLQSIPQMELSIPVLGDLAEHLALSLREVKKLRKHQRLALAQHNQQPIDYSVIDKPIKVEPVKALPAPKPQPTIEEAVMEVLVNRVSKGERRSARKISQLGNTFLRKAGSPKVWLVLEIFHAQGRVEREGYGRGALYGLPIEDEKGIYTTYTLNDQS